MRSHRWCGGAGGAGGQHIPGLGTEVATLGLIAA